jgi:hypothetical protein
VIFIQSFTSLSVEEDPVRKNRGAFLDAFPDGLAKLLKDTIVPLFNLYDDLIFMVQPL